VDYSYSKHAIEQLEKRNISYERIEEIIKFADKSFNYDECLTVFQKIIEESIEDKQGIIIDYDPKGNIVAIEILNASARMESPNSVVYEVA